MTNSIYRYLIVFVILGFNNLSYAQTQIRSTFWEMKLKNWTFLDHLINDTNLFKIETEDEATDVDISSISNCWHMGDSLGTNLYIIDEQPEFTCENSLLNLLEGVPSHLIDTLYISNNILVLNIEYDTINKRKCELYFATPPRRITVSSVKIFLLNYHENNIPLSYLNEFKNLILQITPVRKN